MLSDLRRTTVDIPGCVPLGSGCVHFTSHDHQYNRGGYHTDKQSNKKFLNIPTETTHIRLIIVYNILSGAGYEGARTVIVSRIAIYGAAISIC